MQAVQRANCLRMLSAVETHKSATYFQGSPETGLPDDRTRELYRREVPEPRDLLSIRSDLLGGKYTSVMAFIEDVNLCFDNARRFCSKGRFPEVCRAAAQLQRIFQAAHERILHEKVVGAAPVSVPVPVPSAAVPAAARAEAAGRKRKQSSPPGASAAWLKGFEGKCLAMIEALEAAHPQVLDVLHPPVDLSVFADYALRVDTPMSFSVVCDKLRNGNMYTHPDQLAADVRLIFSNFFTYNMYGGTLKLRVDARNALLRFERDWSKTFPLSESVAHPFLKKFLLSLEDVYRVPSASVPDSAAVVSFMDPVQSYYGGEYPAGYLAVVKRPMHLGAVIFKTLQGQPPSSTDSKKPKGRAGAGREGGYEGALEVLADARLIASNCEAFSSDPALVRDAKALLGAFERAFDEAVAAHPSKPAGVPAPKAKTEADTRIAKKPPVMPKADEVLLSSARSGICAALKEVFKRCLEHLKQHFITPVAAPAGLQKVRTAAPFMRAVDPLWLPDYATVIKQPMYILKVEKKINVEYFLEQPSGNSVVVGAFASFLAGVVARFVADLRLIRDNALEYNQGEQGIEVRVMANKLYDYFEAVLRSELAQLLETLGEWASLAAALRSSDALADLFSRLDSPDAAEFIKTNHAVALPKETKQMAQSRSLDTLASETFSVNETDSVYSSNAPRAKAPKARARKESYAAPDPLPQPPEPADEAPYLHPNREYAAWELACIELLQRLKKHEFIDRKRAGCIGNFFLPVIEVQPTVANDYLAVIRSPMDLGTLEARLLSNGILDAEMFLENLMLVFENAVRYNEGHLESDYAIKLAKKCQHLVEYSKWLAYETLPLKDDSKEDNPERLGALRESIRDVYREKRMSILRKPYYSLNTSKNLGGLGVDVNDCNKLLKDLEKRTTWGQHRANRKAQDKHMILFFAQPVDQSALSDYAVFVRKPMDLSTAKAKLDPPYGPPKYSCYGEFVDDLRLIFSNAVAYNKIHEQSDTTGWSEKVLSAALHFQAKLECLVALDFSIDVCDKIVKDDIECAEKRKNIANQEEIAERERRVVEEYRTAELKKARESDSMFAADLDKESKKKATIQAEMSRRELEAEIGSSRALALLEAENRRKLEEEMFAAEATVMDAETLASSKGAVYEEALRLWTEYEASLRPSDALSSAKSGVDGEGSHDRDATLGSYRPFRIANPLKKLRPVAVFESLFE